MSRCFRRQRQHADRRQTMQVEDFVKRSGTRLGRLCAQSARTDEGAFEVDAEHTRGAGRARVDDAADAGQCVFDALARIGHGGGQQAGCSVRGMQAGDDVDRIAALHHVAAAAAMDVQIDEAGQDACFTGFRRCHRAAFQCRDACIET